MLAGCRLDWPAFNLKLQVFENASSATVSDYLRFTRTRDIQAEDPPATRTSIEDID